MRHFCHPTLALALPVMLLLAMLLAGCDQNRPPPKVARAGEPDVYWLSEAETRAAAETARRDLSGFIRALRNPGAGQSRFAVKARISDGNKVEYVWITDLSLYQDSFVGKLSNQPVSVTHQEAGDPLAVPQREVLDWMYVDGDRLVGGYTIRPLLERMTPVERAAAERRLGLPRPPPAGVAAK